MVRHPAAFDGTESGDGERTGGATPKFFVEMTKEELVRGLEMSYWIRGWTAFVRLSARPESYHRYLTAHPMTPD
jgi:hypothetical protein